MKKLEKNRESARRREFIAQAIGIGKGFRRRAEYDHAAAPQAEGAMFMADQLGYPEVSESIKWGFDNPDVPARASSPAIDSIAAKHGLKHLCYYCDGTGKNRHSATGACNECGATGQKVGR